ncbi:AraC family transcriptional regulator [Octadecabacter ascidiaceicola]|uniref:HTH-type transcriptional regulator VirS n=1 Tax=Octadecabacter ascidiaceicola TaxID=1655543 RepID=A0A238JKZ8_9RHOB|nr:AraC family transcriptional regulator [Octadecabacter ascidiaceicola]SMX30884.1 HTH-type transcriptional regulator VirS [Octadecabacter ascidiaceicola]
MTQNDRHVSFRPVAPVFVAEALDCARKADLDIDRLLHDARVPPDRLDRLNTEDFGRIWLTLSLQMRDEFFGLGARPMPPGSTTLLGHAIRGAQTLEIAMKRALRFLRVVLDEPYGTMRTTGRNCVVELHGATPSQSAFTYRAFFLILHGFNCWSAKERIPIKAVSFPCPEPVGQSDYRDFFGVPVVFDAPVARLVFDQKYLSRRAARSEKDLKTFLRTLPEAFLRGYRDTEGLKHVIVEKCLRGAPADWPDADGIADDLGMSRSTLHRMLKDEGHSVTLLKDEQRRNRATVLLSRTDQSISQISEAVGYADEGAFYRAFYRWYQTTPGTLREKPGQFKIK